MLEKKDDYYSPVSFPSIKAGLSLKLMTMMGHPSPPPTSKSSKYGKNTIQMLSAAPSFNNNVKHHVRVRDMLENIFKSEKYFN